MNDTTPSGLDPARDRPPPRQVIFCPGWPGRAAILASLINTCHYWNHPGLGTEMETGPPTGMLKRTTSNTEYACPGRRRVSPNSGAFERRQSRGVRVGSASPLTTPTRFTRYSGRRSNRPRFRMYRPRARPDASPSTHEWRKWKPPQMRLSVLVCAAWNQLE
jgi:hypothetical protein